MTLVVTGATGQLGRLAVQALLDRAVPAEQIVAAGRNIDKLADLEREGVQVRAMDFDDAASLRAAFADAGKVLLISGSEVGKRVEQHRNAIEAAEQAGVELLAYTSVANADTSRMQLASEHQATEQVLRASGVPFALLRNGWYLENYTEQIPTYLQYGAVLGSAEQGLVSGATRADYADAAAAVLIKDAQAGKVYELGGDVPFTLADLAEEVGAAAGRSVSYQDLSEDEYTQALLGAGLPEPLAVMLADSDRGIARGELQVTTGELSRLIGRPTTSLKEAVNAAVGQGPDPQA